MSNYYIVEVWYTATGYKSGIESTGCMHTFYVEAESFGDAIDKANKMFRIYEKAQTRPGMGYEGLKYQADDYYVY